MSERSISDALAETSPSDPFEAMVLIGVFDEVCESYKQSPIESPRDICDIDWLDSASHVALVLKQELSEFFQSLKQLTRSLPSGRPGVDVLLTRERPPSEVRRYDGVVRSFICNASFWRAVKSNLRSADPRDWCFRCVHMVMNQVDHPSRILVRQIPLVESALDPSLRDCDGVSIIVPHRGPERFLRASISHSLAMDCADGLEVLVGLDEDVCDSYGDLRDKEGLKVFCGSPAPVGPYVLRQAMIEVASSDWILYQDSDDVPCTDRLEVLISASNGGNIDMVGCHELEVNEMDSSVRAYRFPLDVSAILSQRDVSGASPNASEPVLHATCMLRRQKFLEAGGLSTNRRIANDSQFLLRAHFTLKIANVDEFLYLRRVHPRALTIDKETRSGNELRQALSERWVADFKAVKAGSIRLDDSSLKAETHGGAATVKPL